MGKAYVCDMTGAQAAGEGIKSVRAQLGDDLVLAVAVQVRTGPQSFGPGEISPAAAKKIEAALMKLAPKAEAGKK